MLHVRSVPRLLGALILAGLLAAASPAQASFHFMKIVEVFPGAPGHPDAQYVVLQMYAGGQNFVSGHAIIVSDATGLEVGRFTFGGSVPNGTAQAKILIATPQALSHFGLAPTAADLAMTPVIPLAGGRVCFDAIDCVAWGSWSGDATGVGTPAAPRGLVRFQALRRKLGPNFTLEDGDDTNQSAADFELADPAPENNAGAQGTFVPPWSGTCGNGIVEPHEECDSTVGCFFAGAGTRGNCTLDWCRIQADGASCDDGNACTGTSSCAGGACVGGSPVGCTASDECHDAGTCAPATGQCSNPVAPGRACTGGLCSAAGVCEPPEPDGGVDGGAADGGPDAGPDGAAGDGGIDAGAADGGAGDGSALDGGAGDTGSGGDLGAPDAGADAGPGPDQDAATRDAAQDEGPSGEDQGPGDDRAQPGRDRGADRGPDASTVTGGGGCAVTGVALGAGGGEGTEVLLALLLLGLVRRRSGAGV